MPPDLLYIVQNLLNSACGPHTRTDGGYFGQTPPENTVQFRARLEDNLSSFKPDSWNLDAVAKVQAVDNGVVCYINTYSKWVSLPLSGDAPQEVVAWQAEARKSGV